MHGQLRRSVQHCVREMFPDAARRTQVLYNQRICARLQQQADIAQQRRDFTVGNQRIDRDIGLDAVQAAVRQRLPHLVRGKIFRTAPRVKSSKAQIDCRCAVLYGGAHRVHGARRGKQLRQMGLLRHLSKRDRRERRSLSWRSVDASSFSSSSMRRCILSHSAAFSRTSRSSRSIRSACSRSV